MREYGSDYKEKITEALQTAYDSVDPNYSSVINNLSLECKDSIDLQQDGIDTACDATTRINSIRSKIISAKSILIQFYDDVDESSVCINKMAADLWLTIENLNLTLSRINDILSQTGEYSGVEVTPQAIIDSCTYLDSAERKSYSYWKNFYLNPDGSINEDAVEQYFSSYDEALEKKPNTSGYDCATIALAEVVDSYLAENDYSDEAMTEMLNLLSSHMFKQSFDGITAYPQEDSFDWTDNSFTSVVYFDYEKRKSAVAFLGAFSNILQVQYSYDAVKIDGQKNNIFLKRSELITSLEAVTSYDHLSIPVEVNSDYVTNKDNYAVEPMVEGYYFNSYIEMPFPGLNLLFKSASIPEKNHVYKGAFISVDSDYPPFSVFNANSPNPEVMDVRNFTVVSCKQDIDDLYNSSGEKIALEQLNSFMSKDTSFFPRVDFSYVFAASRGDALVNPGNMKKFGDKIGEVVGFGETISNAGELWGTYSGHPVTVCFALALKALNRGVTVSNNRDNNEKIEKTIELLENKFMYSEYLEDIGAIGASYYFNDDVETELPSKYFYYSPAYAQLVCNYANHSNDLLGADEKCKPNIFDPEDPECMEQWGWNEKNNKNNSMVSDGKDFDEYKYNMRDYLDKFQEYCGIDQNMKLDLYSLTVDDMNALYSSFEKWQLDHPGCAVMDSKIDDSYYEELKNQLLGGN